MQNSEFYQLVLEASHIETIDRAEVATDAVLETLGETLTAGEAKDVATQLPDELAGVIEDADHDGSGYDRNAFVNRVGERLQNTDLEPNDAERYADGVTDALTATLTKGELENLKAQLDAELDPLFEGVDVNAEQI
ncbi:DUF2267 domain-containing protein [Halostagnicola bangensis]